jgi:hypothetical protein
MAWSPPLQWLYCVLDEGHIIRSPKSKVAVACKRVPALHRLILTGTPVQNTVSELWSLFDFLMPGFLGSERAFNAKYGKAVQVRGGLQGWGRCCLRGLHGRNPTFRCSHSCITYRSSHTKQVLVRKHSPVHFHVGHSHLVRPPPSSISAQDDSRQTPGHVTACRGLHNCPRRRLDKTVALQNMIPC